MPENITLIVRVAHKIQGPRQLLSSAAGTAPVSKKKPNTDTSVTKYLFLANKDSDRCSWWGEGQT